MLPLEPPAKRPWRALQWRPRSQSVPASRLRLETVQTYAAYEILARSGTLRGDPALGDPDFAEAYAWLATEMDRRLPTRGPGFLWAWARIGRRDLLRNLRRSRGEVLLVLDVPAERVLLHGFGDWHAVLNRSLIVSELPGGEGAQEWRARAEPMFEDFESRLKDAGCDTTSTASWPLELREEVEASWAALFDPVNWVGHRAIQATLHSIEERDVVEAVHIR